MNPLELDAACDPMMGVEPSKNRYLSRAADTFENWSDDVGLIKEAGIRIID